MLRRVVDLRCAALLLCACAAAPAPEPERLNVLWITADDLSAESVNVYGCPLPDVTPNIDRLAAEGFRLERGHVSVAICQPTRAVWMTGRYSHNNGARGFLPIREGVPTLAERVRDAGWYTGLLGKTPHVIPTRHGAFDVIVPAGELEQGRGPERYAAAARAFFEQAGDRPFFLMANSHDPHRPFAGSAQEAARNARSRERNGVDRFPEAEVAFDPADVPVPGYLPDLPAIRLELAEYYTSVKRADATAGALLDALDEAGLADRTIVVFVSDHGMPLPFSKTNCWRQSTRVPWIVRWPGVTQPGAVDTGHFVSGVDLAPTLLDALGLPPLPGSDGRSFVPLLRGGVQEARDAVFTQIDEIAGRKSYPMRAVHDARWSYVFNAWSDGETVFRNESQSGRAFRAMRRAEQEDPAIAARVELFVHRVPEELYDSANDPHSLHNLAGDPQHRARLEAMRSRLRDWMVATGDPLLETFDEWSESTGSQ